ncbi:Protein NONRESPONDING TO OXYLIPINS 2, mitochondrial [Linum perenne]
MATRYRALSKSTASLFRYTVNKPTGAKPIPTSTASFFPARPSSTLSRLGSLQSLLPLHSAVSSARLTSCLGTDTSSSRSLSQGMLCNANPGV